jgi:dCTP deaminase
MILSDGTLLTYRDLVRPFDPEAVQPASIDLRLNDEFVVFDEWARDVQIDLADLTNTGQKWVGPHFVLDPGMFVLGSTVEIVNIPTHCAARVEGKSSLGRLGLLVHMTAGYIDPGFQGRITLELFNARRVPIILHAGLYICQLSVARLDRPAMHPYRGRYQGDLTTTPSKFGWAI